ncbi:MoxR family ATPase [Streptomyces sp. NPDC041068]|uniref:AAA family ATPase n=1 Tax=Streptomyces sp. NPDC041068 TaxID=3155130 RepID=UPI0033ED1137
MSPDAGLSATLPADTTGQNQLDVADALLTLLRDTATEPRTDTQLEALTLAVAADLPVLLWGEPGIGKTAALNQLATALDLPLTTVIASVHEPSDFSGLPVVGEDPAEHGVPMAPPDWAVRLVRAGRGLLFLDELSTAPPAVQAALLRLVLERRIGALRLPPGVRIVAAANPRSSAADGWELSPPLANRFVHLQWTHDHDVVVRGLGGTWPRATLPPLAPEKLPEAVDLARRAVCGLLAARPRLVHQLPSNEARRGGAWPSPRSWEMALRLTAFASAAGSSREVLSLLVRGTVGDGPGLELLAALDRMDLPDPEALLADPASADLPHRGDLRQAVLDGVVGGGGTDLRTGFAKALRTRPRPDVVVALTDGQTPWPDTRPPCRTVVGLFPRRRAGRSWDEDDPDHAPDAPDAWARVVDIGSASTAR